MNFYRTLWYYSDPCGKISLFFNKHILYVNNDIQKPYKMGVLNYAECLCEYFEIAKFPPPPRSKNEDFHKSAWDTSNKPFKEGDIRKAIKDSLYEVMYNKFK